MTVLQLDTKFREPTKCGCGRKGKFRLISKEMIDAQKIVLEEAPEDLEGSEQPKRLDIFLKADLVSPMSEKRTNPGSKNIVTGILKEVPILAKDGGRLTRYDLMLEANYVESVAEDFTELNISPEEIKEIKELSEDPKLFKKLIGSIAPSIYGHDKVKEALILQLFGGVRKVKDDKSISRGDIHILLIGDPGCISGDSQVALLYNGMERIDKIGQKHMQPIHEIVTKIRKSPNDKPYDVATNFQHYKNQPVLKLTTETGKEIICTYNQPLLTKNGWERADKLDIGKNIRVMPKIPNNVKNLVPTNFSDTKILSKKLKKVHLPKKFTPELAALCGYILGDGNIHTRGYSVAMYVNEEEKDLVSTLSKLCTETFSIIPSIRITNVSSDMKTIDDGNGLLRTFISTQQMHIVEINSRQIVHAVSFLSNKRVPQAIFKSPSHVVSSFISWLFEADGCAFSKGRGRTSVQLKSVHKRLLQDVQLLLLYYGIQSRIYEDNLCIRRCRDIQLFAKYIGFNSSKKKYKLKEVLHSIEERSEKQKRKSPQRYERIASIESAGIIDVFDFEVPKSHTFIANGIVCHNSGKSQMLKRISIVAPKSRYVSGKGASAAGLTASVVKDEFLRGYALEAGALVLTNKGICCIDELDKMSKEDTSAMHEALEQQCFHYNTIISTGDGCEFKIGDFVENLFNRYPERVIKGKDCFIMNTKDFDSELLTTDWNRIFKTKIDRVSKHIADNVFVRITLRNGRSIMVTPEHPIFIIDNGQIVTKRADSLSGTEFIPIPLTLPIDGLDQEFDVSEHYNARSINHISIPAENGEYIYKIAGYLLSEGSKEINRKKIIGINFTNKDLRLIEDFEKYMFLEFSIRSYRQARIDDHDKRWMSRYISRELAKFFEKNLPEILHTAAEKEVPKLLMKGTKENIAAMLSCMFQGDGHVSKKERTIRVAYSSTSKRLAEQVQDLLLRFSIRSNITVHKGCYRTSITGYDNIARFYNKIGFVTVDKNSIILEYLETKSGTRTIKDNIPVGKEVLCLLEKYNIMKIMKNNIYTMRHDYIKRNKNISKRLLRTCVIELEKVILPEDRDKLSFIKNFAFGDIGFEKIASINTVENTDQKWTYDVTIEPNHTFISQNMVLHNTISINKANISATLRAETTVLAAANPKFGRFDPYELIPKQIDLPSTLINRFDLIFPIRDIPNKAKDEKTADFILQLHQKASGGEADLTTGVLKKYIAYARQNINPNLTDQALEEIKEYYVKMRSSGEGDEGFKAIPISARQLEALIRLSEASARARLSDKVSKADARRAIDLVHFCLSQIGVDPETGKLDIDRLTTGITASQRSSISVVKEIIHELEQQIGKQIPVDDILMKAKEKGLDQEKVEEVLDKLKKSGDIFNPQANFITRI